MNRRLFLTALSGSAFAQRPQNPSPMVEHTRVHDRMENRDLSAQRQPLSMGTLFVPARRRGGRPPKLLVFFHGGPWLPEAAAAQRGDMAVLSIHIPGSSDGYVEAFSDVARFPKLLAEAEQKSGSKFPSIALGGWSAGCGAPRAILRDPGSYERVQAVMAIDGIHAGYVGGKPGPLESQLEAENLAIWVKLARDAAASRKQFLVTHSEVFPGTFASTTETADWIVKEIGLKRKPVLKWGPRGSQQLSEVRAGKFLLMGFAGNSAPDHVDQLHSLPEFLKLINW